MVPRWFVKTFSPTGNLTKSGEIRWMSWRRSRRPVIWWVAHVLRIQIGSSFLQLKRVVSELDFVGLISLANVCHSASENQSIPVCHYWLTSDLHLYLLSVGLIEKSLHEVSCCSRLIGRCFVLLGNWYDTWYVSPPFCESNNMEAVGRPVSCSATVGAGDVCIWIRRSKSRVVGVSSNWGRSIVVNRVVLCQGMSSKT